MMILAGCSTLSFRTCDLNGVVHHYLYRPTFSTFFSIPAMFLHNRCWPGDSITTECLFPTLRKVVHIFWVRRRRIAFGGNFFRQLFHTQCTVSLGAGLDAVFQPIRVGAVLSCVWSLLYFMDTALHSAGFRFCAPEVSPGEERCI